MNLTVTLEHRFDQAPDGSVWTQVAFDYAFWQRYLTVFDSVRVVARVRPVTTIAGNWLRADGAQVSFVPVPYYVGPWQYFRRSQQIHQALQSALTATEAIILRVPSQLANVLESSLRQTRHPFGLEIVGDPYDGFAPGATKNLLRPFFRWWFTQRLKHQCQTSCATAYVTATALQRRYPSQPQVFSTDYSSIELPDSAFISAPRQHFNQNPLTLITVGSLAQLYKAPDVLIDAVALGRQQGLKLQLMVVGDGQYRRALEARAKALGLQNYVQFYGQLPAGQAIRDSLDRADLFVLPSRQEGLPRAMIEAMARGLPCIGSRVGGIPELLPDEDLVPVGNAAALAAKIAEFARNPDRLRDRSRRNLKKAWDYHDDCLKQRRTEFYGKVQEATTLWLTQHLVP